MGTRIYRGLAHAMEQIMIMMVNKLTKQTFYFKIGLSNEQAETECKILNAIVGENGGYKFYVR